jgi:D-alanyl-D-alanine carboxypeptidase
MIKQRIILLSSATLFCTSILLAGCSDKQKTEPEPVSIEQPNHSNQPEPEPVDQDIETPTVIDLSIDPEQINLSPGSSYKISAKSELSDHSIKEISMDDLTIMLESDSLTMDEEGSITISEDAAIGSTAIVKIQYEGLTAESIVTVTYSLDDTIEKNEGKPTDAPVEEESIPTVTNPTSVAVMVNKQRSLPKNYVPDDLVQPDVPFSFTGESEKKLMRSEAAKALEELFAQAEKDEININAVSGYRSYITQKFLFNHYVRTQGEEHARRYSAYPGTSEHQTGLAMDVSSPSVNNILEDILGETKEGQWLAEHAPTYGFIIRYPQGKEEVTGYAYEPWHLRYVGKDLSTAIAEQGITLEEYFAESVPVIQEESSETE